MNAELDWADLELLHHILAQGTLSAAARALGIDQTTAARRLARIERRMGVALFDRDRQKLVPTPLLRDAAPALHAMDDAARLAHQYVKRSKALLRGVVHVSSVGFVHAHIIGPTLGAFLAQHPEITLDLTVEDHNLSLQRREADIAIRLGRGSAEEARIRRLGALRFRLYRPRAPAAPLSGVLAYDERLNDTPEMRLLAELRPDTPIVMRSNRFDVLSQASLATGAAFVAPELWGDRDERFERAPDTERWTEREVFRLTHPERGRDPTVTMVAAWLDRVIATALA